MLQPIYRRCVWSLNVDLFQADGITPMDMSDKRVSVIVKRNKRDSDDSTVLPRIDIENSKTNRFVFTYSSDETASVPSGVYWIAVKIFESNDQNSEVMCEQIEVKEGGFQDE